MARKDTASDLTTDDRNREYGRWRDWLAAFNATFDRYHEDRPGAEEAAIRYDRGESPQEAYRIIMHERTGDDQ